MQKTMAMLAALVLVGACAESNTDRGDAAVQSGSDASGSNSDAASDCQPRWRTLVADRQLRDLVVVGEHLYVAGNSGSTGWIGELGTCKGTFSDQVVVAHGSATETQLLQMVAADNELLLAGSLVTSADPGQGLYARVTTAPLSVASTEALFASVGQDATHAIARAASGDVWMTGVANATVSASMWGVKATTSGATCGFTGPAPASAGRGVVALGSDVYLMADSEGHALVAHYDNPACTLNPCSCVPDWTATFEVGTASTVVLAAEGEGSRLYAMGMAGDTGAAAGDLFAFVVQLDASNGAVLGTYRWDPTTDADAFTSMATDGTWLLVAGGSGWDGGETFDGTSASVHRIPSSLVGTPAADWIASPASTLVWSVAKGAGDDFYAAGLTTAGASVVLRCDASGICGQ